MQRTRLSTLVTISSDRLGQFFLNPWRRLSLLLISILLGIFIGEAVSTTAGQTAAWDVLVAGILSIFTEVVSIVVYRSNNPRRDRSLPKDVANAFKIGIMYGLFLEALKIGS